MDSARVVVDGGLVTDLVGLTVVDAAREH